MPIDTGTEEVITPAVLELAKREDARLYGDDILQREDDPVGMAMDLPMHYDDYDDEADGHQFSTTPISAGVYTVIEY